ncbi:MAG: hypothetical protein ACFFA6_12515 [Promethearchaeota archaeon]
MITESQKYGHPIKCSVCHLEIKNRASLYQAGVNLGIVCVDCYRLFSTEDLELVSNLFIAFGGYFGQYKRVEFSILRILKAIHKDLFLTYDDVEELNVRMLHRALLHGITPKQYIENLELIFED